MKTFYLLSTLLVISANTAMEHGKQDEYSRAVGHITNQLKDEKHFPSIVMCILGHPCYYASCFQYKQAFIGNYESRIKELTQPGVKEDIIKTLAENYNKSIRSVREDLDHQAIYINNYKSD
jgi:hypothetical protein